MNHSAAHEKLVKEILLACGSLPAVRLFARRVGYAVPLHGDHPVHYGINGEADIQGFVKVGNLAASVGIEVKTGKGKLEKDQIRWRDMFISFGGIYCEARSVDDVMECLRPYYQTVNNMFGYKSHE